MMSNAQCASRIRLRLQAGISTSISVVPLGTHWHANLDSMVRPRASSSISCSSSLAGLQLSNPFRIITWHVEQAAIPPQAWSMATPAPLAISRRLPGRPVRSYGILAGSTSRVLLSGWNVTLNRLVGRSVIAGWIYGLTPAIKHFSVAKRSTSQAKLTRNSLGWYTFPTK